MTIYFDKNVFQLLVPSRTKEQEAILLKKIAEALHTEEPIGDIFITRIFKQHWQKDDQFSILKTDGIATVLQIEDITLDLDSPSSKKVAYRENANSAPYQLPDCFVRTRHLYNETEVSSCLNKLKKILKTDLFNFQKFPLPPLTKMPEADVIISDKNMLEQIDEIEERLSCKGRLKEVIANITGREAKLKKLIQEKENVHLKKIKNNLIKLATLNNDLDDNSTELNKYVLTEHQQLSQKLADKITSLATHTEELIKPALFDLENEAKTLKTKLKELDYANAPYIYTYLKRAIIFTLYQAARDCLSSSWEKISNECANNNKKEHDLKTEKLNEINNKFAGILSINEFGQISLADKAYNIIVADKDNKEKLLIGQSASLAMLENFVKTILNNYITTFGRFADEAKLIINHLKELNNTLFTLFGKHFFEVDDKNSLWKNHFHFTDDAEALQESAKSVVQNFHDFLHGEEMWAEKRDFDGEIQSLATQISNKSLTPTVINELDELYKESAQKLLSATNLKQAAQLKQQFNLLKQATCKTHDHFLTESNALEKAIEHTQAKLQSLTDDDHELFEQTSNELAEINRTYAAVKTAEKEAHQQFDGDKNSYCAQFTNQYQQYTGDPEKKSELTKLEKIASTSKKSQQTMKENVVELQLLKTKLDAIEQQISLMTTDTKSMEESLTSNSSSVNNSPQNSRAFSKQPTRNPPQPPPFNSLSSSKGNSSSSSSDEANFSLKKPSFFKRHWKKLLIGTVLGVVIVGASIASAGILPAVLAGAAAAVTVVVGVTGVSLSATAATAIGATGAVLLTAAGSAALTTSACAIADYAQGTKPKMMFIPPSDISSESSNEDRASSPSSSSSSAFISSHFSKKSAQKRHPHKDTPPSPTATDYSPVIHSGTTANNLHRQFSHSSLSTEEGIEKENREQQYRKYG